jgi:hypothetical protein
MHWYKKAQMEHPQGLEDRNQLNEKIHYFEQLRSKLDELAKIVFQDGSFAKSASMSIAEDKKVSSHPKMRNIMLEAEQTALDSPWRFADLCYQASDEANRVIAKLKETRHDFTEEKLPNRMKGWHKDD